MIKKLLLILIFILASTSFYAQWTNQNPVPDDNNLNSVFFIDDNTGWIVGSDGFVTKTTNAGEDWITKNSSTSTDLSAVKFVDNNTGWIIGKSGLILKTTNGGTDWAEQFSGSYLNLNSIHFYNSNIGWVVGYGGTILKTTDGGNNWNTITSGTSYPLFSVCFIDELTGWAVGGDKAFQNCKVILLKTTDGGNSWFQLEVTSNNIPGPFYSVYFINTNVGWIGGTHNFIFKTTNGGNTWFQQNYSPEPLLKENYIPGEDGIGGNLGIFFKDENKGWIVGGGDWYNVRKPRILSTTDGGSTWDNNFEGPDSWFSSVFVTSIGRGWAVGNKGNIFISDDDGLSWNGQLSGNYATIKSIFFDSENKGWATGFRFYPDHGQIMSVIMKTTNSGKIWETKYSGPWENASGYFKHSIFFLDELFGWITTTNDDTNILYNTSDGGESWFEINTGLGECTSLDFISSNLGWASTIDGLARTTDGGYTWLFTSSENCNSLNFSNATTGWAVGEAGKILKSTDGGQSWVTKTSGTSSDLFLVQFYNNNIGMCVGSSSTILLSTDGGENWIIKSSPEIQYIKFINSTTVLGYTSEGQVYKTTNSGDTWESLNTGLTSGQTAFFINESVGWVGGDNSTISKYQNDILPVEILSFGAVVDDGKVQLNWETATEINNSGFQIERSIGEDAWINIGFVEGSGNSTSLRYYSFVDNYPAGGSKFQYRLKQIDTNGNFEYLTELEVEIFPNNFELYQNYPNPFNPSTKIRFQLPEASKVVITIFNILGVEVKTLINEHKQPGVYEVELNSQSLASGTYVYRIVAGNYVESRKMILLK